MNNNSTKILENSVWSKFKSGDKEALSIIFLTYFDELYHYGSHLCADEDLVKDCIQNLFLKLWSNKKTLDNVEGIKPYLYKSLRNHIINELNKRTVLLQHHNNSNFQIDIDSHEENLIQIELNEELMNQLNLQLDNLQSRQKEALYLKFYEGLPYEKIAEIMNLQLQSVRNLVFTSLQTLRKKLNTSLTYRYSTLLTFLLLLKKIF